MVFGYYCWYEQYLEKNFKSDFSQCSGPFRLTIFNDEEIIEDIKSELKAEFLYVATRNRQAKKIRKRNDGEDDKRCKSYAVINHPAKYYRQMLKKLLCNIVDKRIKDYKRYKPMSEVLLEQLNNKEYFDDNSVFELKDIFNSSGLSMDEQSVLSHYFINEYSLDKIAKKTGVDYEVIKKRFQRAKEKIKRKLLMQKP